jgi:hypothetical protein
VQSATRPYHHFVSADANFLTVGQVRERYGASGAWIAPRLTDSYFPEHVHAGGEHSPRRWRIADLEASEQAREPYGPRSAPLYKDM